MTTIPPAGRDARIDGEFVRCEYCGYHYHYRDIAGHRIADHNEPAVRTHQQEPTVFSNAFDFQPGEFHETNGWFFKRLEDGSVRIRIATSDHSDLAHILSANSWASVVAHVADGGSAEAYSRAEALHGLSRMTDHPAAVSPDAPEPRAETVCECGHLWRLHRHGSVPRLRLARIAFTVNLEHPDD